MQTTKPQLIESGPIGCNRPAKPGVNRLGAIRLAPPLLTLVALCLATLTGRAAAIAPLQSPIAPLLLVVGNSIVLSLPNADTGWAGSWGMAASTQERDFAHVLGAQLGARVEAVSIFPFEYTYYDRATWSHVVDRGKAVAPDYLVLKLGDNVNRSRLPEFEAALGDMIDTMRGRAVLVCVGTWYRVPDVDAIIERACTARRGRFVNIADMIDSWGNHALSESHNILHSGVASHPGDLGMARIAERVYAAVTGPKTRRMLFVPMATR
jgi:hypothetical protein